jgi:phosphatidylglycerol phospholipase C
VKAQNDPERLFTLMHEIISGQEDWETTLAPRVILGLWHPRFIVAAIKIMPYLQRSYIGASIALARDYFWDSCQAFSIHFAALATTEGARFRWVAALLSKNRHESLRPLVGRTLRPLERISWFGQSTNLSR